MALRCSKHRKAKHHSALEAEAMSEPTIAPKRRYKTDWEYHPSKAKPPKVSTMDRIATRKRRSAGTTQWTAENPEKTAAAVMVRREIAKGRMERLPCVVCGNPNSDGHHEDYAKPLDVIWLCKKHHRAIHEFKRNSVVFATLLSK